MTLIKDVMKLAFPHTDWQIVSPDIIDGQVSKTAQSRFEAAIADRIDRIEPVLILQARGVSLPRHLVAVAPTILAMAPVSRDIVMTHLLAGNLSDQVPDPGALHAALPDDDALAHFETLEICASLRAPTPRIVLERLDAIRREREAAAASLTGARAEAETVRLAWLAELLAAYSNARFYQEALALTRTTVNTRQETVNITRSQFEAGEATEYEVAEAQALLSTARASLPQYAALFDANVYAIATLLNEPASPIMAQMQKGAPQLPTPGSARTGVPAELLRNRPDVRSAEADLATAVAEIGVAEAALYPSLSLTGTVGRTEGADAWGFGPYLTFPVFNQGLLQASRDAQISVARQAEITWRASISGAVEDVQVAQSNLSRYRQRAALLRTAANDYGRALALAQENYRSGAITLLDLLETDRNTNAARIPQPG